MSPNLHIMTHDLSLSLSILFKWCFSLHHLQFKFDVLNFLMLMNYVSIIFNLGLKFKNILTPPSQFICLSR